MPRPSSNNNVDAVAPVDSSSSSAGAAVAGFASPLVAVASASVATADVASAAAASTSVGLSRRHSAEDAPLAVRLLHNQGFIDGAGGWICGVAQVATGHPLDTIVSDTRDRGYFSHHFATWDGPTVIQA